MYIFVRLTAVVTILFGVLLMLAGLSGAGYGFFQNDALTLTINNYLEQTNDMRRVVNAGYAGVILGTLAFIFGMFAAAFGQLLLVFVDLATHTRETNIILRGFRAQSSSKQTTANDDDEKMYGTELESVG
ncbi:MAG: hypothetical protein CVU44_01005 [Chloroflexi bacterium HGW-Chloroflexi-6]|nr:MAG: hypothetical protein CVU44_01005 [Chloroflexi bacterium HGW-Chloroflexi-6]